MKKNKRLNKAEKRRQRNYLKKMSKNNFPCLQSATNALVEGLRQVAIACANSLNELAQRIGDFFENREEK